MMKSRIQRPRMWALRSAVLCILPWATAPAQDASPAEKEWNVIQTRVTPKLVMYREADEETRAKINFAKEMADIGAFVRKYTDSEPDYAAAAQVYMGKEILAATLGMELDAVQMLRGVAGKAENALIAGMAAVHAAEILMRLGDEGGVRGLVTAYEERKSHDPGLLGILKDMERRVALRPGKPFPAFTLKDLNGQDQSIAAKAGKVVVFAVLNVEHQASADCLTTCQQIHARLGDKGVAVWGVSLDREKEKLEQAMTRSGVEFPVSWEKSGWKSPVAERLGISALPMLFVLSPDGKVKYADVRPKELASFVDLALEEARDKGTLK